MHDWSSLTLVTATVTRVMGTLVSLRLPDGTTTVRWPAGVPVSVGLDVAVRCYTDPPYLRSLIAVGIELDGERYWVDEDAIQRWARPEPVTTRPAFLPVLVEVGLLDSLDIDPRWYGASPVGVLMTHYRSTEAIGRGFLYYDHRWPNWTKDPIADLATLVRRSDVRTIRAHAHELIFELGATRHVVSELFTAAARIDAWLADVAAPLRLFAWDTRGDTYAFLARPLAEGLELARALGDDGLRPASTPSAPAVPGDGDYF